MMIEVEMRLARISRWPLFAIEPQKKLSSEPKTSVLVVGHNDVIMQPPDIGKIKLSQTGSDLQIIFVPFNRYEAWIRSFLNSNRELKKGPPFELTLSRSDNHLSVSFVNIKTRQSLRFSILS